ncbi:SsgA family sporulation/cell division regulator [Streptomyces sp. NPDC049954]|uniref:SsgA family sporulation/cell division regulator n=1 Tax=Streptomyces sp. NPDC049954 TaxID=3155779 RepID=UPI003436324F
MAEPSSHPEVRDREGRGAVLETVFRQVQPTGLRVPLPARLDYDVSRPYEVTLDLLPPGGPAVRWVLSRELLRSGTRVRCGAGDVRLAPVPGPGRAGLVLLRLGPPQADALFCADRAELADWLGRTEEVMPPGEEFASVDWDALIGRLLR